MLLKNRILPANLYHSPFQIILAHIKCLKLIEMSSITAIPVGIRVRMTQIYWFAWHVTMVTSLTTMANVLISNNAKTCLCG